MDSTTAIWVAIASGVIVVIGSILWLRLHACLALLLGALLVGFLTPAPSVQRFHIEQELWEVVPFDDDSNLTAGILEKAYGDIPFGTPLAVFRRRASDGYPMQVGQARVIEYMPQGIILGEIYCIIEWQDDVVPATDATQIANTEFKPGDLVVSYEGLSSAQAHARLTVGERLAAGFGATCAKIGILIAMASIVGRCMMDSGAADRIVRGMLRWLGEKQASLAFLGSGFLLGIPVFFDTVFYLMIPLAKALHVRTRKDYLLYVLSIVAGATMTHSLVPPTPGPLYVAEHLGIDMLTMSIGGCIVGAFAALAGYTFAIVMNRRVGLEMRDSVAGPAAADAPLAFDDAKLPPFSLAIMPLLLPTVLISLGTLPLATWGAPDWIQQSVDTLSNSSIALACAAVLSMLMLWRYSDAPAKSKQKSIEDGISDAGSIILITSAGGAFGEMLKQTGVTQLISDLPQASPVAMCALAFVITVAIRTAQGSATVAMITSVGVFSGLAESGALGFHPVYLALAIGCGSKPFAWMNDSGFWVITRMSGMTEREGLKFVTPMSAIMGVVGLCIVLLGVTILPNF